jgi:hypothetical protein
MCKLYSELVVSSAHRRIIIMSLNYRIYCGICAEPFG